MKLLDKARLQRVVARRKQLGIRAERQAEELKRLGKQLPEGKLVVEPSVGEDGKTVVTAFIRRK